jgi:hypothetical protein
VHDLRRCVDRKKRAEAGFFGFFRFFGFFGFWVLRVRGSGSGFGFEVPVRVPGSCEV